MKNFMHFFTRSKPSKVLLHNTPMWNRGFKEISFFSIFSLWAYESFLKSWFYIKNLFFWGTFCWCSSNIERMGGRQILQILHIWPPFHCLDFWATLTYNTSKEQIFDLKLIFKNQIYSFIMKNLKKIGFPQKLYFI